MTVDFNRQATLARQLLQESKSGSSTWAASGSEFGAWKDKVLTLIRRVYGPQSPQERDFSDRALYRVIIRNTYGDPTYGARLQKAFEKMLLQVTGFMEALVQDLEVRGSATPSGPKIAEARAAPGVFIAHGGESPALDRVCEFLRALGMQPIVVEKEPSEGRNIDAQVGWCLDRSDCALILATKGDIDGKTGDFIPRGNILIEVGRCQERFRDKTIYLLEEGTKFPTNISSKVWERFTPDNMERAFLKIVRELVAFGFLKAVKGG